MQTLVRTRPRIVAFLARLLAALASPLLPDRPKYISFTLVLAIQCGFPTITCGPALRLRGGCGSDGGATIESSEPNDEALRRQRKASGPSKPRKGVSTSKNKGKDKAHESDPEPEDLFARANISTLKSLVGGVQFYGSSHRSLAWSREIQDRYIHGLATMSDGTHVIITINPELARLTLEAIWIMVDTMFTDENARVKVRVNSVDKRQPDQLHKTSTPRGNFIKQEHSRERKRELESETMTRREAKKLWDETTVKKERAQVEIASPRKQIDVLTKLLAALVANFIDLFPGSNLRSPLAGPMSDQAALNSDIMSPIFQNIIKDHPMYPINGDGEVWATDPYEQMIIS
ncbi:hypothetical protein B0H17DRAFT_1132009 [Mycena rosella]|uniref:Uncharacterized protein n=1 Tax=Mycena rosella TaxID=1033263 RepID=A0AAD7DLW1_MYCRO|nr:hypothetical protein B0H17DRAFT_1132009 [Mycena rosella]